MNRRFVLLALTASVPLARGQVTAAARISVLTDLIAAIGAAGESLTKLTEGFKSLIVAGKDSYKFVAAERERVRLMEISRQTAILIAFPNAAAVESLDQYINAPVRTQEDWARVVLALDNTLSSVQRLLADVKTEDGSFVLEPAFLLLNQALASRINLLSHLAAMPAPQSPDEIALLREASSKYKILIASAQTALTQLNSYVKNKK